MRPDTWTARSGSATPVPTPLGAGQILRLAYRSMSSPATMHEEDALARTYDARLMRRLLTYVGPYRTVVAGALFFLIIEGGLQLAGPLLTRQVIDVALPAKDSGAIITATILFAVTLVAQFICSFAEAILTNRLGQSVM